MRTARPTRDLVIWMRTEAGHAELKAHALVRNAPAQNLLRAIDGTKPMGPLLKYLPGVTSEDVDLLVQLGLIEPRRSSSAIINVPPVASPTPPPARSMDETVTVLRLRRLALVATRLASVHLGLSGLALTSAIGRAETAEELDALAGQLVDDIRARKGDQLADAAARELHALL